MPGGRRDNKAAAEEILMTRAKARGGMRMRRAKKKVCSFCVDKSN